MTTNQAGPGAPHGEGATLVAGALSASLTASDVRASVAWYRDVVGFVVEREYERGGALAGVVLRAGQVRILVNQDDGARGLDRAKGEGISLMVTAPDVDAIALRITAAGGTLDSPPADMPWGARAFRVRDPDGFRLAFSTA